MYKFSRDVIFVDDLNLGCSLFSRIICYQPLSSTCIVMVLRGFNFVDDKLTTKTAKITSLENLYICSIFRCEERNLLSFA